MQYNQFCNVLEVVEKKTPFHLPEDTSYFPGASERCIEIPYVFSLIHNAQKVLDVGISLADQNYFWGLLCLQKMGLTLCACDIVPFGKVKNRFAEFPRELIDTIDFSCQDIRETSHGDNSFDLTLCVSVLEHIGFDSYLHAEDTVFDRPLEDYESFPDYFLWDEDRKALNEMLRITKNNGRVLLTVPFGAGGIFSSRDSKGRYAAHLEYNSQKWNKLKSSLDLPATFQERCFKMFPDTGWQEVTLDTPFGPMGTSSGEHLDEGVLCVEITKQLN